MLWLLLSLNLTAVSPFLSCCKHLPDLRGEVPSTSLRKADGFLQNDKKKPTLSAAEPVGTKSIIIWLTEQDHDFGELKKGKPATFIFKFKNAAPDTIVLQTVRTTCGCTAASYTEEPIAPGAVGEIAVEFDAYQSGAFSKKIRVFFDRQRKAEILWIRGEVN